MVLELVLHILEVVAMLVEKLGSMETDINYEKYSWNIGHCTLDLLDACDSNHIQFYLFTRKNRQEPILLQYKNNSINHYIDERARTKVLIHGYAGHLDFNGTALVREAYLEVASYNIIVVDWGPLAQLPCYPTAVLNTWQAGKCTAKMLVNLAGVHKKVFSIPQLHIIGFSLGAHVAAFASNNIYRLLQKKVGRITGLDPALPFFASLKSSWKLSKGDAQFVDIIHTNSGIFGKIEATGHADFYVNGGTLQPACKNAKNPPLCSHVLATVYFAESILASKEHSTRKHFFGVRCSNFLDVIAGRCQPSSRRHVMGDQCSKKTRGMFYVETRSSPPFAKN